MKKIFLFLFIFSVNFSPLFANAESTSVFYKIFYYVEGKKAMESLKNNYKSIDVIAPQSYGVNSLGELKGGPSDDFILFVQDKGMKVMPLVTNSNFSETVMNKILDDTNLQDKIIKAMVEEGKKMGYWGWQFDFEQMKADKRDKYSEFVKRAYPEFKKNGQIFSVAVIAQISLNPADYPNDLWNRVIGVYDYKVLGANSDFLSIMSYDQPKSGGPVASLDWVKKVVRFSIGQVPNNKLSLGIPFYFWKWNSAGKIVDIGGYGRVNELLKYGRQIIKKGFDPVSQVAWVRYWQNKNIYTAWYENDQSFARKVELASIYKLHGFSAWTLGLEDPKIHSVIKTKQI